MVMSLIDEIDSLLPAQFFARRISESPERALMVAMLQDAFNCVMNSGGSNQRARLATEAQAWLEAEDDGPFSFVWVCDALGLDAERIRARLKTVREQGQTPRT